MDSLLGRPRFPNGLGVHLVGAFAGPLQHSRFRQSKISSAMHNFVPYVRPQVSRAHGYSPAVAAGQKRKGTRDSTGFFFTSRRKAMASCVGASHVEQSILALAWPREASFETVAAGRLGGGAAVFKIQIFDSPAHPENITWNSSISDTLAGSASGLKCLSISPSRLPSTLPITA